MKNTACPVCGNVEIRGIANIGTDICCCKKCGLEYVDPDEMFRLCEDKRGGVY